MLGIVVLNSMGIIESVVSIMLRSAISNMMINFMGWCMSWRCMCRWMSDWMYLSVCNWMSSSV